MSNILFRIKLALKYDTRIVWCNFRRLYHKVMAAYYGRKAKYWRERANRIRGR